MISEGESKNSSSLISEKEKWNKGTFILSFFRFPYSFLIRDAYSDDRFDGVRQQSFELFAFMFSFKKEVKVVPEDVLVIKIGTL